MSSIKLDARRRGGPVLGRAPTWIATSVGSAVEEIGVGSEQFVNCRAGGLVCFEESEVIHSRDPLDQDLPDNVCGVDTQTGMADVNPMAPCRNRKRRQGRPRGET